MKIYIYHKQYMDHNDKNRDKDDFFLFFAYLPRQKISAKKIFLQYK